MTSDAFYAQLPAFHSFSELTDLTHYTPLPEDWLVVITDVRNSTRAVAEGKYKDVNALGAASIVAVLNAVRPVKIPYLFGGDGAVLCIPSSLRGNVEAALVGARLMGEAGFNLSLRTGLVDMKTILSAGKKILVGKFKPSTSYEQAMLKGDGLALVETLIKDVRADNPYLVREHPEAGKVSFAGFECRWNEVPSVHGEIVTLIVKAEDDVIYSEVIKKIAEIYGREELHHPLRADKLSLSASPKKLSTEVKIKSALGSAGMRLKTWASVIFYALAGKRLISDRYKRTLISNTDYRKFDGVLRMVISGTPEQRLRLKNTLDDRRKSGRLHYGLHVDPGALITCIIGNYADDHVHFVDGSSGGYTLAAEEMKRQRR